MYGYEPIDLIYISTNPHHTHSQKNVVSLLSHTISIDPQQCSDVVDILEWDATMTKEYSSMLKNHTCNLIPPPKGRKLVWYKWAYITKYAMYGFVDKHKVCIVAKIFSHVEGIDYFETSAPIAKMDSIFLVLSLVASQGWSVYQMDVRSVF